MKKLITSKKIVKEHIIKRTLVEMVIDPAHVERVHDPTAALYRKNHNTLVHEMGLD